MSIFKPYKRIYLKLDDTLSHGVLYTHLGRLNAKDMVTFNEVLLNNGQQIVGPIKWKEEWISNNTLKRKKNSGKRRRKKFGQINETKV